MVGLALAHREVVDEGERLGPEREVHAAHGEEDARRNLQRVGRERHAHPLVAQLRLPVEVGDAVPQAVVHHRACVRPDLRIAPGQHGHARGEHRVQYRQVAARGLESSPVRLHEILLGRALGVGRVAVVVQGDDQVGLLPSREQEAVVTDGVAAARDDPRVRAQVGVDLLPGNVPHAARKSEAPLRVVFDDDHQVSPEMRFPLLQESLDLRLANRRHYDDCFDDPLLWPSGPWTALLGAIGVDGLDVEASLRAPVAHGAVDPRAHLPGTTRTALPRRRCCSRARN